ncbi:SMI1/KNR4 family protein [Streptomyces sp. NBC_00102]|uniref:SMI1/KNR4 family protein n=1 Tax=Streptomyces sp. NBC_00102 TaxID=2975652 RepID=UPI00224F3B4F|nr:SMI1/KNR4 family protein [Streptomyces sp. NBC_00102]MCX5402319.1 SMI1/KNR4 family protein [Streptomyces sp. NBC_00102]
MQLILPPPIAGGDVIDWGEVRTTGVSELPQDYKSFVALYGGGEIDEYVAVITPPVHGSGYGDLPLGDDHRIPPEEEADLATKLPGGVTPRLILFAQTASGDGAYWLACGNADEWRVAVWRRQIAYGESRWVLFDGGMVDFILSVLEGVIEPFSMTGTGEEPHEFTSWREI